MNEKILWNEKKMVRMSLYPRSQSIQHQSSAKQSMLPLVAIPLASKDSCENTERGKQVMIQHGSTQCKINEPCELVRRSQSIEHLYLHSSKQSIHAACL